MLEPYALKGACTVLRGGGEGDLTSLPEHFAPQIAEISLTRPWKRRGKLPDQRLENVKVHALGDLSLALSGERDEPSCQCASLENFLIVSPPFAETSAASRCSGAFESRFCVVR
jgi:hypothetical protein